VIELFGCAVAFVITALAARRSLGWGLVAMFAFGYAHGVFRARFGGWASAFLFDAAVFGLYTTYFIQRMRTGVRGPFTRFQWWVLALIAWPCLVCAIPVQHPYIQLVGLRAAIYFVPFLLIGARCQPADLATLARGLAILNLLALAIGLYLFVVGVEVLFPQTNYTEIIYGSNDVANYTETALRIPSTFGNAHAYGCTMVMTLPFIVYRLVDTGTKFVERLLLFAAIFAAGWGVALSACRYPVVLLGLSVGLYLALAPWSWRNFCGLALLALGLAALVLSDQRLQRFMILSDTDAVVDRIGQSANSGFLDLLAEYPFGAGLGRAWGTSIPSFLEQYALPPIGLENEYSRILIDQGLIGLLLWVGFLVWLFANTLQNIPRLRYTLLYPMAALGLSVWATGFIAAGLFTGIPTSALLLLSTGTLGRFADSR
jgi:hypothetical protein